MPTKLPRITISLKPETKAILDQLQEVSERPASAFISELLDEACKPMFVPIIEAMKLAKEKKLEAWDVLNSALAGAQYNAAQLTLQIHDEKRQDAERKRGKRAKK